MGNKIKYLFLAVLLLLLTIPIIVYVSQSRQDIRGRAEGECPSRSEIAPAATCGGNPSNPSQMAVTIVWQDAQSLGCGSYSAAITEESEGYTRLCAPAENLGGPGAGCKAVCSDGPAPNTDWWAAISFGNCGGTGLGSGYEVSVGCGGDDGGGGGPTQTPAPSPTVPAGEPTQTPKPTAPVCPAPGAVVNLNIICPVCD